MGAPGTKTGVVRVRGRGDADVVGIEERNEHEQREMGGSKCRDGTVHGCWERGSALVLPSAPCTHRETAGTGPLDSWGENRPPTAPPVGCQIRLCARSINAPNASH